MAQFNPEDESVDDVIAHLKKSDKTERERVLALELGGKKRKTVLEPWGLDASARYDATGRQLYPWEVTGKDLADADRHPEESAEARKQREAQNQHDATVASTQQLGSTAGAGSTTAAGAPGTGTGAASGTAGTTSGGAASTGGTGTGATAGGARS